MGTYAKRKSNVPVDDNLEYSDFFYKFLHPIPGQLE
jgi:hypothetical protein